MGNSLNLILPTPAPPVAENRNSYHPPAGLPPTLSPSLLPPPSSSWLSAAISGTSIGLECVPCPPIHGHGCGRPCALNQGSGCGPDACCQSPSRPERVLASRSGSSRDPGFLTTGSPPEAIAPPEIMRDDFES